MDIPDHENEKIERLRRAMYSRDISPKLKDRPRRQMSEDGTLVPEDWQKPETSVSGSVIAPVGLRASRRALKWLAILALAFSVGAATFFAYYFILGGGSRPASPGDISVSISGPQRIAGGEIADMQITVSNQNRSAIELADLVVTYPPGTRTSPTASKDATVDRISVGTLESGGVRNIPVKAAFAGSDGQKSLLKAELEYRLQGSSAIFVAQADDYELVFSSSPISISVDANEETISGQPVLLTLTVSSNASAPIRDVLLNLSFPFGFKFTSALPAPAREGVWELGDITPGLSRKIEIRGTLSGEAGDERVFRAVLGTRKSKESPGVDTSLAENSFKMRVSKPFLGLAVSVNQGEGSGVVVAPGDTVNVSVAWQNNLLTAISDAVIVARLSGINIDGQTVRSTNGFFRSADSAVLWDKTTTGGALANLSPGAKGALNFSFIMPPAQVLETLRNPRITITVSASVKRLSEEGVPESIQSAAPQVVVKVASNLQVSADGHYYQNPFGTSGPMPPKAGRETAYAILFTVTNTTSKINNAVLTARMPSYVRSLGYIPTTENISFNKVDGTLKWNIGDIDSGVGVRGNEARLAAISIALLPSTSQIGEAPAILQEIALTGTDASTGEAVSVTAPDVTTNIRGDEGFSSANATVVK